MDASFLLDTVQSSGFGSIDDEKEMNSNKEDVRGGR